MQGPRGHTLQGQCAVRILGLAVGWRSQAGLLLGVRALVLSFLPPSYKLIISLSNSMDGCLWMVSMLCFYRYWLESYYITGFFLFNVLFLNTGILCYFLWLLIDVFSSMFWLNYIFALRLCGKPSIVKDNKCWTQLHKHVIPCVLFSWKKFLELLGQKLHPFQLPGSGTVGVPAPHRSYHSKSANLSIIRQIALLI